MTTEPISFTFPFEGLRLSGLSGLTATGRAEIMAYPEDPSAWEIARIWLDDETSSSGEVNLTECGRDLWGLVHFSIRSELHCTIRHEVGLALHYADQQKVA